MKNSIFHVLISIYIFLHEVSGKVFGWCGVQTPCSLRRSSVYILFPLFFQAPPNDGLLCWGEAFGKIMPLFHPPILTGPLVLYCGAAVQLVLGFFARNFSMCCYAFVVSSEKVNSGIFYIVVLNCLLLLLNFKSFYIM